MEETLTVDKQGSNLKSRTAYAFGNVGQSAFYNALSTYFIVYVTSSLFAGVDKGIATKLIGGQYDATLADSTVIGYTSTQSGGKIEQIGETFESAPQGIAIAKDDAQLTEAVQKAMN